MNQTFKKIISVFLSALLILQVLPMTPVGFAAYTDHITINGVTLDCYHKVTYDPQKDVYRLNLSLDAELYEQCSSNSSSTPLRSYFTANYTGDYLIQLWGGKGADGMDESDRLGGDGGAGGYVHGIVHLEKGQTLFYSLGGNGSTTYVTGQGGGANGGGHGGTSISYSVGGGGGYSAIFLFDESEFNKYLDSNGNLIVNNINETDRATKYLMIAGGGGGGGAAPGTALIGNNNTRWPAHGGAGGTIDQSISGTIEAVGVTVPGTFYAGFNGSSSGTSDAYIGRGGTTTPGVVSSTVWDWSKGEQPNDWTGSANRESEPGAGGAGNLRGGAGGGGFCGGSGGIQQSLVSPTQVGGGGGGSSFIAATANGYAIDTTLDGIPDELLDPLPDNIPGGAVSITYLPLHQSHDPENILDLSAAKDVTVSFTLSKYFDVSFFTAPQLTVEYENEVPVGYEELKLEFVDADDAYKFTISNFDLVPTVDNPTGTLELTFEFVPKAGFAGGNGVPLLKDNKVSVTTRTTDADEPVTQHFSLHPEDCSVNVPLSLPLGLGIQSHTTYQTREYSAHELYRDDYTAIREALKNKTNADPMYDFIDSIGTYSVGGLTGNSWTATISQTTTVPVSLTMTPKATDVISGAGTWNNTKTFTDNATITFLDAHTNHINGQVLSFTKQLEYNEADGTYTYTLNATANASSTSSTIPDPIPISDPDLPANETIYPVPHDGVYLIQVWGANGANGSKSGNFSGGEGGEGGYASIYLHLNQGDQLKLMQMGVIGANPIRAGGETSGGGGGGGTYTGVSLYRDSTTTPLAIAGGGGGGGNAMSQFWGSGQPGIEGVDVPAEIGSELAGNYADYNGKAGEPSGYILIFGYQPGAGGPAGKNYVSNVFQSPQLSEEGLARLNTASTANPSSGAGYILVTCLELTDSGHVDPTLTDYTLDLTFSDYFEVVAPQTEPSQLPMMSLSPSLNNSVTTPSTNGFYSILPDTSVSRPILPSTGGFYSIVPDTNVSSPITPGSGGFYSISPDTSVTYSIGPTSTPTAFSLGRAITHTTTPLTSLSGIDALGGNVSYNPTFPNRVTIPDIKPTVEDFCIDFTVVLTLKPRTDFLGGNSVPILTAATIAQPLHDDNGAFILKDDNQIIDTKLIPIAPNADFANVVFADSDYTPDLTVTDQHLGTTGETVTVSSLYSWSNEWPGAVYTWEDDYVAPVKTLIQESGTGENLINAGTLGPFSKNTHYDVTVGVVPVYTPAQVGPALSNMTDTKEVSVFVLPRVTYKLDYLTTDVVLNPEHNCASLWPDTDHVSVLSPVSEGYALPGSITVTYDEDKTAVPFSYDSATGEIWISSTHATKDLTITASAKPRTFSITFAYEDPATGLPITQVEQHLYGAPIDVDREEIPVTGYTFAWNWYWRDGKAQTTMPAYDLTVVGIYTPRKYTVRVEYYDENGNLLDGDCKPYEKEYDFGSDYSVQTPYRSGYVSSQPIVEGTVDKAAVEALQGGTQIVHTVTYAQSSNTLRVNHILIGFNTTTGELDRAILLEATTDSILTGDSFTVEALDSHKSGYAIRFADINGDPLEAQPDGTFAGTMDTDGVEISVIYTPNPYTVTFETDGGVINGSVDVDDTDPERPIYTRRALYGNLYRLRVEGSDPPAYSYVSLPTQVIRRGYSFDGWYLVPNPQDGEERITSDHTVDIAENHTLYAKWVPKSYSLTVEYDFADGTEALPTDAYSYGYNEAYTIKIPQIPGYTAHLNGAGEAISQISGTMPAEFVVRQIIYKPITCTLTVSYAFADGLTGSNLPDLPNQVSQSKTFGETYRVESKNLTGQNDKTYYPSQTVIEGVMDDPNGKTFTVIYYEAEPVISATITWSDLTFTYDRGTWNPSALRYENSSITPNCAGANAVTVTNNKESNVPILAHFSYQPYDRAPDIEGRFYLDGSEVTSVEIPKPSGDTTYSKTVKLQLAGSLPDSLSGTLISGQCVVTITTLTGGG